MQRLFVRTCVWPCGQSGVGVLMQALVVLMCVCPVGQVGVGGGGLTQRLVVRT